MALAIGVLSAVAGADLEGAERDRLVRYIGILVTAVLAIGVPHVLFPDPRRRALQLQNTSPAGLLRRQAMRWAPVPLVLTVPALVIGRGWVALEGAIAVLAVGAFAFAQSSVLGPRVRAWESLEAGGWYRKIYGINPALRFLVPDPLVPGILITGKVFLFGGLIAIAGQRGGTVWALAVAAFAGQDVVMLMSRSGQFDRPFWTSNAVWSDAFRQTDSADAREPVAHDAIYWAPSRIRPTVWAGLVSLDRRFPLGRIATVGLVLIGLAHLGEMEAGIRLASVALYVVVLNGAVALTVLEDVIPGALEVRLGGAVRWMMARFLMNVRWLPPLFAVGLLMVWLADLPWSMVTVWAVVDLAAAAISAVLVTVIARIRFRRALA